MSKGYHRPDLDDSGWQDVLTYSRTLSAQGLPDLKTFMWYRTGFRVPRRGKKLTLLFMAVGGYLRTVYVNGKEVGEPDRLWSEKQSPFQIDITEAVKPGENLLAVRIQHGGRIPAGIVRPVLLIEKGE